MELAVKDIFQTLDKIIDTWPSIKFQIWHEARERERFCAHCSLFIELGTYKEVKENPFSQKNVRVVDVHLRGRKIPCDVHARHQSSHVPTCH